MNGLDDFIADMSLLFCGKPVVYIDVGAHHGETYAAFESSDIIISEAHLFEPSSSNFSILSERIRLEYGDRNVNIYCSAVSDIIGNLYLHEADDMTRVISKDEYNSKKNCHSVVDSNCTTLDSYFEQGELRHVSIIKIDIEGHEISALRGAEKLLSSFNVDVIYIEVGFNLQNKQQTYYRDVEDYLGKYDYKIFRIYEQFHEWPHDSLILRRANIAFVSKEFAGKNKFSSVFGTKRRRDDVELIKEKLDAMRADLDCARRDYLEIKHSTSWKITAPLRVLKRAIRCLFKYS